MSDKLKKIYYGVVRTVTPFVEPVQPRLGHLCPFLLMRTVPRQPGWMPPASPPVLRLVP